MTTNNLKNENWLYDWWMLAEVQCKESIWNSLPEDILEYIEKHAITLTPESLSFIEKLIDNIYPMTRLEMISLTRFLRALGEVSNYYQELVRPYLTKLLSSNSGYIRSLAVEVIWQSNDKTFLPSLKLLLSQEKDLYVLDSLEHVIPILERIK